ncbi:alpha/beta hydrolase family protein [Pelagicoccus sp. SDUM812003]|uniref:alpha/beta hydrolase n=1 Tax=Pelagicoccus sp. SDUM812003 TaxID=3041267 RepID=UPI00281036D0|nr:alpha/beta hydrolase family protein [Pelagicoccus sp. SDUM812003]MDQ8202124.1 alpha/beta hydrolase family protein [Pelagicoccus sp. SDUM812003]
MALIQFDFKSELLGLACSANIVVNQRSLTHFGSGHRSPVLYLLHGLSQDHSGWIRRSSIERYAERYDVTIVMPAVHRSFYANTRSGYRYFDFVADELPELCRHYFPISSDPHQTHVAGLSMGGYGAFKLALTYPGRFGSAVSLSGPLDLSKLEHRRDELFPEWQSVFGPGEDYLGSENDLLALARRLAGRQPRLLQSCGDQDYLCPVNRSFHHEASQLGLEIEYQEPPGDHDWAYWDAQIQDALAWMQLPELPDSSEVQLKDSTPRGEGVFKNQHE